MAGMNAHTGRQLDSLAHIQQSVADILTTPIGSRVMRREYGSLLPELIDQPLNGPTALRAYAATVVALMKWEPRIRVQQVTRQVSTQRPGRFDLIITAQRVDNGERVSLAVPLRGNP
jgi:phage baseplate assembly protein W|tara:strand:+ start:81 stop:431 length:351 start_codon:yes stop_codon:yes gene_type:complete